MFEDFYSTFVQPALLFALIILVIVAIAWVQKAAQGKQADLDQKKYDTLTWLIETGVWAAEQAYKSGTLPKELREEYVIKFLQGEANKYHLAIDVGQIAVYIKAEVAKSLNKEKLTSPAIRLLPPVVTVNNS